MPRNLLPIKTINLNKVSQEEFVSVEDLTNKYIFPMIIKYIHFKIYFRFNEY